MQYEFYTILVARGEVTEGLASPNEPEVCGRNRAARLTLFRNAPSFLGTHCLELRSVGGILFAVVKGLNLELDPHFGDKYIHFGLFHLNETVLYWALRF